MDIFKEITLDMLSTEFVSVVTNSYAMIDGIKTKIGPTVRKGYSNSTSGRAEVLEELSPEDSSAIFAKWGDSPTIEDPYTEPDSE